ncbi:hypothetical protein ALC62_07040 [Cyphomyrmex costatus]|uniref:Integrase catalytic domain-containing protein n=1 Tax=Cyphomyrmex costatus TaxID=456900 RepID=A0A151II66_9HYME|nr:hypothetical protein ALC62_07040 [Cyphomyrmex costatus]
MFFTHWIARFGASRLITSDQGSQFEAQLFDVLTKLVSSKRCRTIAYHLEANGIIERWHRSLKIALMFHGEAQWTDALPVSSHIRPKLFFYKDLYNCSHVFLKAEGNRRPLDQPYTGPHKVLERISDKVFNNTYLIIQDSETTPTTAFPFSTNIPVQCEPKTYSGPATKRKTIRFKI